MTGLPVCVYSIVLFFKHIPKLKIFGTHKLQTFKYNTLINELLLMQFYLFNMNSPKLHHRKWRQLRVILFRTFSTSSAACWCCSSSDLYWKLCYKLPSVVTFTFIQAFDHNFDFFTERRHLTSSVTRNFQNFRCLERRKVDKKQTYTKTEAYKLF